MRVLITHELFPPEVERMGEKLVYEIARRLRKRGIYVEVLTTGNPKIREYDGIKTVRLPVHRYLMNLAAPWIYNYAKKFDIIQTNNYNACFPSYVAARFLKKPVVCLVHGMYGRKWLKMRGLLGYPSMFVEKLQINHDYDKIIFTSDYAQKAAVDVGVDKKITTVIKPGFDFDKYKVRKKETFVLFVGRLVKQKGLDYLIEAARRLPEVKFVVVGTGKEKSRLKSIAPKNVTLTGFVSEKKKIELYSKALIFCFPSEGEGFGFVLLEAMASGCAIVSSIPLNYSGMKVDAEDIDKIVESIKYLMENKRVTLRMGRENRRKARNYKWDDFIDNLINVYEEVLKRKSSYK